jgi:hypothetical protein
VILILVLAARLLSGGAPDDRATLPGRGSGSFAAAALTFAARRR